MRLHHAGRHPNLSVGLVPRLLRGLEDIMTRDNYSYKKYQKELANKKKKEEKRQSKLDKKNVQAKVDPEKASNGDVTVA